MKLSDYVWQAVARTGVKHVFMLPGGGCMHLVDSLARNPDLTYVACLHEQACAVAADAYGQHNGLGVALVTTGPGGTNAITGCAAAWLDSTPVLFISGQVKRADLRGVSGVRQMGFQEVDIVKLVGPITKYAATVMQSSEIRYELEHALHVARSGRPGPVWLDIPLDVQAEDVDPEALDPYTGPPRRLYDHCDEAAVLKVRELLRQAHRPVLLIGNGVRLDGAIPDLRCLIDLLQIPVLTTWKALDLLADNHPLYVGRPGTIGQRAANFALQTADLVISVGARLDFGQIGYDRAGFAPKAKKVVVDVDGDELRKLDGIADVFICARAGAFLVRLANVIGTGLAVERTEWLARCQAWLQRYPVVLPEYHDWQDGVSTYVLVDVLSNLMGCHDVLVPGSSGAASEVTCQAFRVKAGQRVLNSQGLGPMGFGIPAAIGACIASGGRRTVCIDGDGGFAMNVQELETVRRLGLPIKFFVLDNGGYGSIRHTQDTYFEGRHVASDPASGLTLPDYRAVASAFKLPSCLIYSHKWIEQEMQRVLDRPGPVVCVVKVSPQQRTQPRVVSERLPDGTMRSSPLEDLWPFLPRDEFAGIMAK